MIQAHVTKMLSYVSYMLFRLKKISFALLSSFSNTKDFRSSFFSFSLSHSPIFYIMLVNHDRQCRDTVPIKMFSFHGIKFSPVNIINQKIKIKTINHRDANERGIIKLNVKRTKYHIHIARW